MAKLTNFKAQQVEFPTHYELTDTGRGNNIKNIVPAYGTVREQGTPETTEIYNGLQLGNVHTLHALKSTTSNIDYYSCDLDGLNDFGLNKDLKIRLTVDAPNANAGAKLRLNNVDYTILKEKNGQLGQIEAGDFKANKTYDLTYNGSQFIVINLINTATETEAGVVTLNQIKEISPKADLSNYVTFNKGYRNTNSTDAFVRANSAIVWTPYVIDMYHENGNHTGSFHTNGTRAYYRAPNRNSNNWCEIMDNFDRDNLQNQINAFVNGFQFSKNEQGYLKLPNSFIIQWGSGNTAASTNFPIAFPNVCFRVVGVQQGYSEIYENLKIMYGLTNYSFRMKIKGDEHYSFHYIAIGY